MLAALLLQTSAIDAVTFADHPNRAFIPIREYAAAKGLSVEYDLVTELATLGGDRVPVDQPRLFDGTILIEAKGLKVVLGPKRALADLTKQTFTAWQGGRVVIQSPLSSGRLYKDTPVGKYRTGVKEKMHVSSIYGSKMPFSVHLRGNYFIHGSEQTTFGPGSHGCVRLPIYNGAAEWFFKWVEKGTVVKVQGKRPKPSTK